jgi:hypothetical protein
MLMLDLVEASLLAYDRQARQKKVLLLWRCIAMSDESKLYPFEVANPWVWGPELAQEILPAAEELGLEDRDPSRLSQRVTQALIVVGFAVLDLRGGQEAYLLRVMEREADLYSLLAFLLPGQEANENSPPWQLHRRLADILDGRYLEFVYDEADVQHFIRLTPAAS